MRVGREIRVRGQVQGVGFRPFVYQLALRFNATGHVLNDGEGVLIRISCEDPDAFVRALRAEAPSLAKIDRIDVAKAESLPTAEFEIAMSGEAGAETRVTPDAATCAECVAEIQGAGRRAEYAFTNCTNCGPRFTILRQLPYDRAQTSMAPFQMCAACRKEYEDPLDRRFHAQPIACPYCGPTLSMVPAAPDAMADAVQRLCDGQILAIKGLGGFHLACDATNADAVAELRARKRRPSKPLAVMASLDWIKAHTVSSAEEEAFLTDPAAPIVILSGETGLPDGIAPGLDAVGWMLPYTPLHHLLLASVQRPLVMTSGNLSGEPQVIGNDEAQEKLGHIADATLLHNRDIARRLDDSVMRVGPSGPMVLRRARGQVPGTLDLPPGFDGMKDVVAFGAHLKSAICLTKNGQALLSHHLGDLDDPLTWEEFLKADADYAALFDHDPAAVACDLHPDYRSTAHAKSRGLPVVEVQHHHAHLAACLAENAWPRDGGKVAGIILDGLGLGTDGTVWGGELLLGDYAGFERRAHLRAAPLPGGDAAGREPWRNLMARLDQAGLANLSDRTLKGKPLDPLRQAVAKGVNAPLSSSAGRLFDAVAAMLDICRDRQSFEGEAAMRLESLARMASPDEANKAYDLRVDGSVIDPAPLWECIERDLLGGQSKAAISLRFHAGLARAFSQKALHLLGSGDAQAVALSGGCFQNGLLLEQVLRALGDVPVLIHTQVPANDGGLALGQALVALSQMETN
ncbi:MAG: carbamoyltransferase HypF [Dinoroseobacter sp.]|nr:carbamoyltransferase HypF [Dinoroseobacter sp.]